MKATSDRIAKMCVTARVIADGQGSFLSVGGDDEQKRKGEQPSNDRRKDDPTADGRLAIAEPLERHDGRDYRPRSLKLNSSQSEVLTGRPGMSAAE